MTEVPKELEEKIEQLHMLEQSIHGIMQQQQQAKIQLDEIKNAQEALEKTTEKPFRIIGNVMVQTDKTKLSSELKEKQEILDLRLKTLEKQGLQTQKKAKEIQEGLMNQLKK